MVPAEAWEWPPPGESVGAIKRRHMAVVSVSCGSGGGAPSEREAWEVRGRRQCFAVRRGHDRHGKEVWKRKARGDGK